MNWRTVGILFVIVVALGAVLYLMEQEGDGGEDTNANASPSPTPMEHLIQDVTIADVQRLDVTRFEDGFQVSFEREENGDWFQTVPTNTMVVSSTMTGDVSRILNLTSQSTLSADANPLSVYGLDNPQYEILLVAKRDDENVRFDFLIGNRTPTGDRYYAQKQGDPRVHVLLSSIVESMTGLLEDRPIATPTPETAGSG
ncbi:MAG: DUF4340 domain-containing protein [Candidatus Promineifilaceae bacterium]